MKLDYRPVNSLADASAAPNTHANYDRFIDCGLKTVIEATKASMKSVF